jgi:hypothetical protein
MKNFLVEFESSREAMDVIIAIVKGQLEPSKGTIGDTVTVRNRFGSIRVSISPESCGVREYWSVSQRFPTAVSSPNTSFLTLNIPIEAPIPVSIEAISFGSLRKWLS